MLGAFARLVGEHPRARLVVNTSSDPAPLLEEATRTGIVRRLSVLRGLSFTDTARAIRASDVALVPRTVPWGFPIKLLNYMALGVPTVLCHQGYDGIRHDWNAYLAEPTAAGFARAMGRLARDPDLRARIARAAQRTVIQRYRWDAAVPPIEKTYDALTRRKAALPKAAVEPDRAGV